ncbi:MAG: outer membrane beta-barrel protein [Candidatus Solibacter sp.]|nr:outer membrane beta-barrel protein [Candidatus Solibacter sp.]
MVRSWLLAGAVAACSSLSFAQSFEASVGGGQSTFPSKNADIGTSTGDPASGTYKMSDGIRISARMAINNTRFTGHEFGYAYSRTSLVTPATAGIIITGGISTTPPAQPVTTAVPAQNISLPCHQGFYDFLVYAVPEGKVIRPFAAGGVQFTAFSQPNSYNYNRETKYGINYGGGIKVKVKENWGFRLDARQYNMGKPFKLPNGSGRLLMWEFSGAISFLM